LLHPQNEIWVVGVCEGDDFALYAVTLVQYIGRLLSTLLRDGATELSVKSEFPAVYQILDYAIDFGFPFLNEANTILTMLTRPPTDYAKGQRLKLDLQHPWRIAEAVHPSNELLMDVTETMDVSVSQAGRIEFCHIRGTVEVVSNLSGNPMCKVILTPQSRYEDVTFHRCVEAEAHEAKVIPFVPPEGAFTLMKYRVTTTQSTVPVWIAPKFTWSKGNVTFEIALKPEASVPKALENIEVRFDLPEGVLSPSLIAKEGRATFESISREVVWYIAFYEKKEQVTLKGSASTEVGFDLSGRFPILSLKFTTAQLAPSGFKVDRMEVENVPYKAFRGVKYLTRAGNYEFRTGLG
jgi:AP-3 complex subunit mu